MHYFRKKVFRYTIVYESPKLLISLNKIGQYFLPIRYFPFKIKGLTGGLFAVIPCASKRTRVRDGRRESTGFRPRPEKDNGLKNGQEN